MDKVKRLRAKAQINTKYAQRSAEEVEEYIEKAQRSAEEVKYLNEQAAKLNKQADELEQADAQQ